MAASKKSTYRRGEITPRHAWLAALGAFAVVRREALTAAEIAVEETARLRTQFGGASEDARLIARGAVLTLREKVAPAVAKFASDVEARIAPLISKLGLPRAATPKPRKTRKTARKTTSSRGPVPRKVAERTRARKSR